MKTRVRVKIGNHHLLIGMILCLAAFIFIIFMIDSIRIIMLFSFLLIPAFLLMAYYFYLNLTLDERTEKIAITMGRLEENLDEIRIMKEKYYSNPYLHVLRRLSTVYIYLKDYIYHDLKEDLSVLIEEDKKIYTPKEKNKIMAKLGEIEKDVEHFRKHLFVPYNHLNALENEIENLKKNKNNTDAEIRLLRFSEDKIIGLKMISNDFIAEEEEFIKTEEAKEEKLKTPTKPIRSQTGDTWLFRY
ncbi:hypothetical protein ACFL0W_01765 [Nanoarchaeota archaeon]